MKEKGTIRLQNGSVGWWNGFGTNLYFMVRMVRFLMIGTGVLRYDVLLFCVTLLNE